MRKKKVSLMTRGLRHPQQPRTLKQTTREERAAIIEELEAAEAGLAVFQNMHKWQEKARATMIEALQAEKAALFADQKQQEIDNIQDKLRILILKIEATPIHPATPDDSKGRAGRSRSPRRRHPHRSLPLKWSGPVKEHAYQ